MHPSSNYSPQTPASPTPPINLLGPKTMEVIDFREKAWMQARGYHVGVETGLVYYPPKSSLIAT